LLTETYELQNIANANLWPVLAAESLKALLGLGIISLGGRLFLRRIFEVCVLVLHTEWSHFMIDELLRARQIILCVVQSLMIKHFPANECRLWRIQGAQRHLWHFACSQLPAPPFLRKSLALVTRYPTLQFSLVFSGYNKNYINTLRITRIQQK
jgi:hypothetical protein